MIQTQKRLGILFALLFLVTLLPTAIGEEEVKLVIVSEGLPADINAKIFINQTAVSVPLNGSGPAVLRFKKGTRVDIDIEDRVQGRFGTIYLKKGLFASGTSVPVGQLVLTADTTLLARYEWSHLLLQPMFWPLYALIGAALILIAVRRIYASDSTK